MDEKEAQDSTFEHSGIPEVFLKPYSPQDTETHMYTLWEESGFFNPDTCIEKGVTQPDAEVFSMVLPPPNVTGTLHMGSALMLAIEDILVRKARMDGKRTLWIPGTDSAAIATQARVEKDIQKTEGKSRHDLGREELLKRIDTFVEENKSTMLAQMRAIGASLDWSRYAYTMDDARYKAVMEAFVRMYNAGLIYRGNRIVNWDPKGQTTISDDEIVHEERKAKLYTFKYATDFPISISTTRPETKVGDTAVAVHPDDEQYKEYIGKEYDVVFCDVPLHIKIVADTSVEKEFGTGALGVTPAHSQIDWDIADRHDLPRPQVINEYAKMTVDGRLNGMKVAEAREAVVTWLKEENLLEKEEEIVQNVATAERTGGIVEPLPKLQWWIDVEKPFTLEHSEIPGIASGTSISLKDLMIKVAEGGGTTFLTERYEKTYHHWAQNLRPWCISRQIWFGHRIPVWYKTEVGTDKEAVHFKERVLCEKLSLIDEHDFNIYSTNLMEKNGWTDKNILWGSKPDGIIMLYVGYIDYLKFSGVIDDAWISANRINNPKREADVFVGINPPNEIGWYQDPDVLDTWFSSGLWTFSTLGWPENTEDLKIYHPTTIIETGYDIIFFWVARMILMSGFLLGQVPFKTVYLHGLVRDGQGRKISKSLGNNIDPVDMAEKYGMDAVRVSLIAGMALGTDSRISEDKIRGYKHFANKLWNISRFVLENTKDVDLNVHYTQNDQHIWDRFNLIKKETTRNIESYQLHLSSEMIYHYVWNEFADKIIEHSKTIFAGESPEENGPECIASRKKLISSILIDSLKLLHPFMPFVTEAIWQQLPQNIRGGERDLLMVAAWPKF